MTQQPTVLKHQKQLDLFITLSTDLTPEQLAEVMEIDISHVHRYLACLKEGQTLTRSGAYNTEKLSAEEMVARQKGKVITMPWGVVSPPVPHSFIEHR